MGSIRPYRGANTSSVAVGDDQHEPDENAPYFGPAEHGTEGNAPGHQLSSGVDDEERDGQDARQFGFGRTGCFGHEGRERSHTALASFLLDELVNPYPRHGLTQGGDQTDPQARISLYENEADETNEHVA